MYTKKPFNLHAEYNNFNINEICRDMLLSMKEVLHFAYRYFVHFHF